MYVVHDEAATAGLEYGLRLVQQAPTFAYPTGLLGAIAGNVPAGPYSAGFLRGLALAARHWQQRQVATIALRREAAV